MKLSHRQPRHIRKVGPETFARTRDLRPLTHLMGEIRSPKGGIRNPTRGTQLMGGIQDQRPGTLKVGLETRNPYLCLLMRIENIFSLSLQDPTFKDPGLAYKMDLGSHQESQVPGSTF